jgi:hypothetical protein
MKRLLAFLALPAASFAAACVTATPDCTEFIVLGGGPSRSLVYRNHPLETRNERITRATVILHGASRDADNYYRTAVAAAFLAGALEDTIVISPRIASNAGGSCRDTLAVNEISYPCDVWRSGGAAAATPKVTSFDFMDEILRKVIRKDIFPNLKSIVVAGHSAGGQYMNRYQMSTRMHDAVGVPIMYVVSNPSSYAYLDPIRPTGDPNDFGKEFRTFGDGRNCTTYDRWPYGLQNRGGGYTTGITDEQLKKQLAARPAVYLLGEIDILPLGGFDSSCPAMAQGPTRRARGEAFYNYANQKLGAKHQKVMVSLCGHNARCMFTSDAAQAILFPKQ